ncbi:MAG TPA: response regulator [Ktedonobacterales bacterium]|nr:response regulator [Ktedonobacterales bacterium]
MPGTVLIADDDPDILELITALLTEEGFQTVICGDGIEALHLIRTQRLALAIIDLTMPLMSGYELIERLRAEPGEPLPVIAMSATIYGPSPDQLQVDAYLAKPFDLEELLEHVKYLASRESAPETLNTSEQASLIPIRRSIPGAH